jgi:hypothetical protein
LVLADFLRAAMFSPWHIPTIITLITIAYSLTNASVSFFKNLALLLTISPGG